MGKAQLTVSPSSDARPTTWMLFGLVPILVVLLFVTELDAGSTVVLGLALSSAFVGVRQLRSRVEVEGKYLKVAGSWRTELVPIAGVRDVTLVETRIPFWSWGIDWPPFRRTRSKDCLLFWVAPNRHLNPEATRRLASSSDASRLRDEFRAAIVDAQRTGTSAAEGETAL